MSNKSGKRLTDKQRQARDTWYADRRNFRHDDSVTKCFFCQRGIKQGERYYSPHYQYGACARCRRQYNRVKYYMQGRPGEEMDRLVIQLLESAHENKMTWETVAREWANAAKDMQHETVEAADDMDAAYKALLEHA